MFKLAMLGCLLLMLGAMALPAAAQPGGGGGINLGQGGPQMDPAQMQQRMLDNIKKALGSTDEEFKVLQPKIEQVMTLGMQIRGGGMRAFFRSMMRSMGGQGGVAVETGGDNAQPSALEKASDDLASALENKDVKADAIKVKLAAFREARDKAVAELAKAQDDLKSLLTARQEAVLVKRGLLD